MYKKKKNNNYFKIIRVVRNSFTIYGTRFLNTRKNDIALKP